MKMNPSYPLYVVSKGRWESRLTGKALERMNTPYYMVVDEEEYDKYAEVMDKNKILVFDKHYTEDYEFCDDLGLAKSTGAGPKRNWCWQHAIDSGFEKHWVMDDNIASFNRLNRNLMCKVMTGTIFKVAEDFVNRYKNVVMAGFNYDFFCQSKLVHPPFIRNTRIYSCNLIQNDIPFRWRGRYNEDTILSLDVLKSGLATVQFNALLQEKATTQTLKGGNTDDFYAEEGTLPKSQM